MNAEEFYNKEYIQLEYHKDFRYEILSKVEAINLMKKFAKYKIEELNKLKK